MSTPKGFIAGCICVFLLAVTGLGQHIPTRVDNPQELAAPVASVPTVTVTATAKRMRFVSPGTVVQMRLEVYNDAGQKLFDTELRGGNVLDWHLQDGTGERVAAGSYATVLTVKSLSGRLSQRVGMVRVNKKKAAFEAAGAPQLSLAQQQTIGPVETNSAFTVLHEVEKDAITVVTHDGTDGQLTSTTGALTFRTGDVFAGKEKEHMRITEEGRIGVGTDKPEATLDVAGTVRVSEGIKFSDGTTVDASSGKLKVRDANGLATESLQGTGSTNRVAKWTDNAGTLGDSSITEVGGDVGIGTTTPGALLDVTNNTNHLTYSAATAKLTLTGPPANLTANPGLRLNFNGDPDAALSYLAYSHDNISQAYDAYWNGATWVSSHVGANFALYKTASQLAIGFNAGTPKGSTFPAFNTTTGVIFSNTGALGIGGAPSGAKLFVNGNVGISTSAPLAKLDIQGGANADGSGDPKAMAFQYVGGGFRHWIRTRHNATPGSGNAIDFFVNDSATAGGSTGPGLGSGSAHVMTLDGGRVGIGGVLTPTEALSVQGTIQSLFGGFKFPDATVQTTGGVTDTYTTVPDVSVPINVDGNVASILHLDLPAGTYLLTATVLFDNRANFAAQDNTRRFYCLFSGDGDADYYNFTIPPGGALGYDLPATLHSVRTLSSGVIDVRCHGLGVNQNEVFATSRRLTAVKLANVFVQ